MPAPTTTGPTAICSRGPMRTANAPDRAEKASMTTVRGRRAAPGLERGVVRHLLELHGEEEQGAPQRGVDHEGHGVGGAELPGCGRWPERQHGIALARLGHHEGHEGQRGRRQHGQ